MTSFLLANACTGAFKMRSMKEKGGVCVCEDLELTYPSIMAYWIGMR